MPGAWELRNQTSVLCCILHTELVTMAWSLGFRNLQIPGGVLPLTAQPFDDLRNIGCQKTLECGAEWCFMLDSDVIPPHDAVLRLLAHRKPLISGIYHRRSPPVGIPVMQRGGRWVTEFLANAVIEVDVVGAGCLLIHRSILERLPESRPGHHWFDWRVNLQGRGIYENYKCTSEDFAFCYRVKEILGIPTLVDTSIQCRHAGFSQATYGRLDALDVAANT